MKFRMIDTEHEEAQIITVNTINPVREAADAALHSPHAVLIEGTQTSLRLEGQPPSAEDLASMVRQLTEKATAGTLPAGEIAFNRYCSWTTHE